MALETVPTPRLAQAVVLLVAMSVAAFAAEALRPQQRLADLKPKINLDVQIPRSFGEWKEDATMVPILPSPEMQAALDALYSSALARTYVNAAGQRVMLSIAYGSDQGSETTAVHRPEFCYSAEGFEVDDLGKDKVGITGRSLAVRRLMGVRGQRRESITYWVTLDDTATLPGVGRKLAQIRYGFRGEIPDGMLFRVSSMGMSETESFALQDRFLNDLAGTMDPSIRKRYFGG
jgi:EpsI family protein